MSDPKRNVDVEKHGESESEAEFQERMRSMMTSSFSFLGVILGSRLGLFELLSDHKEPMTIADIAQKAGYKAK